MLFPKLACFDANGSATRSPGTNRHGGLDPATPGRRQNHSDLFLALCVDDFRSTYIDQNGLFENSPSYPYSGVQKLAIASDQLVAVYWWLAFAAVFLIKGRRIMVWRGPLFSSAIFVIVTQMFALVVRFEDYSPIATPLVDVFGRVALCLAIAVASIPKRFAEPIEFEAGE
jgi:hypothetical protein